MFARSDDFVISLLFARMLALKTNLTRLTLEIVSGLIDLFNLKGGDFSGSMLIF